MTNLYRNIHCDSRMIPTKNILSSKKGFIESKSIFECQRCKHAECIIERYAEAELIPITLREKEDKLKNHRRKILVEKAIATANMFR